jgi:hypothetical protein
LVTGDSVGAVPDVVVGRTPFGGRDVTLMGRSFVKWDPDAFGNAILIPTGRGRNL